MTDYRMGFDVPGKTDYETVEWILNKAVSNESKLLFQAYDACLFPLPDFSTWKCEKWKQKQINNALAFTYEFDGEVWLDDVMVKAPKGSTGCKHEDVGGFCIHPEVSSDRVWQPCVKGPCPYEECAQKGRED